MHSRSTYYSSRKFLVPTGGPDQIILLHIYLPRRAQLNLDAKSTLPMLIISKVQYLIRCMHLRSPTVLRFRRNGSLVAEMLHSLKPTAGPVSDFIYLPEFHRWALRFASDSMTATAPQPQSAGRELDFCLCCASSRHQRIPSAGKKVRCRPNALGPLGRT